jgi:hypothetical protein
METPDNLRTYQVDLTMHHLGRAVELYFQSTSFVKRVQPWDWILEGRNAFSSIIHAYCGLESAINGIGYELFFNTDSSIYIPPERRDFPLARMIDAWHGRMQSVDKLKFILAHEANAEITQPLAAEVQEVNNLRNWIVHGFSFKRTVLLEPKQEEEGVFTEVDREDTVSWEAKFPRLKFNSLDELDAEDACKVLSVVLRSLKLLSTTLEHRMFLFQVHFGSVRTFMIGDVRIEMQRRGELV